MKFYAIALAGALFALPPAKAQDYDPPGRVARLSYASGEVSFQPGGTQDWVQATPNRPMTTGDNMWVDRGSRAALHIGSASIGLAENTALAILNLTDTTAQFQLNEGSARIRVKWLGEAENFEVDTPNLAFTILRPGIYKINVSSDGATTVIKDRSGEGEVTGGGSSYTVHAGELDTFSGTGSLSADIQAIGYDDDFERWCQQRDHHEDVSVSARYVSVDAIGYDDLDDYGGWRPIDSYGMVWFPHETAPGWAPYHYGHWAYISPWGYTWVDDAPWGFTPFHYGRWVAVGGQWGWVPCPPRRRGPGPVYVRPVYAPALVAWIGGAHFGIGVSIGGGGGGVGWFPLGPREVYVPSYPVSRTYVNNVNVSNTVVNKTVINNYYTNVIVNKNVNVTNVTYVNQRVPGAVAATTPQAFASGQGVAHNMVRMDPHTVAAAPVAALTPAAVPQHAAVLGGRAIVTNRPPAAIEARAAIAKTAPPPPPLAFAQRQSAIQSNGGRPLSLAQSMQIERAHPPAVAPQVIRMAPPARSAMTIHKTQAAKPEQMQHAAGPPARFAGSEHNAAEAPEAHPVSGQLEEQHARQNMELHAKQDQEYRQTQERQQQQMQTLQQERAAQAQVQQAQQQHQQQLRTMEQRHEAQVHQLQQKQVAEHQQARTEGPAKSRPEAKTKEERRPEKK